MSAIFKFIFPPERATFQKRKLNYSNDINIAGALPLPPTSTLDKED